MTVQYSVAGRRLVRCFALALLFCASARAQKGPAPKPTESEQLQGPQGLTEVGVLDGAAYRIDIPNGWHRGVIVYYHGYAQTPVNYHIAEKLVGATVPLFERHFAIIQSGYSQPGWALPQAYPETEDLRRYFAKKFGPVGDTYVLGQSMGGALVMVTLELNPKPYLGGLDLCGAVGPTSESFERRFAMRAAFDHYFPGVMPPILNVPPDYIANDAARDKVAAALKANPAKAENMRNLLGVHTDANVAANIAYYTFVIGDMERRAGGNPFDNRNFLYTGTDPTSTASDYELNDNVRRYAALPSAQEYLMRHYTPSGRLEKPMLAVHTLYDPTVFPGSLALYDHMVEAAGFGENLVQEYVKREGHCNITEQQVGAAFDELAAWVHHGPRPAPGEVRENPEQPHTQPQHSPSVEHEGTRLLNSSH